jgi:hypothetical protein
MNVRMFRLLLPVFVVLGLFFYWKKLKHATPEERAQRLKGLASIAAMVVAAVFAVRAGSWGWVAGGLLAIVAMRAIPYLSQSTAGSKERDSTSPGQGSNRPSRMTREEALRIFDLSEPVTHDQVQARYREMMRGVHPDRGGSNHLAAQVNEAYRLLSRSENGAKRS